MSFADIVRKAIPDADPKMIDYILWNHTAYPFKKLSAREVYKAADRWRRAQAHGIVLCELCSNRAREDDWVCPTCDRMLHTQMGDDK